MARSSLYLLFISCALLAVSVRPAAAKCARDRQAVRVDNCGNKKVCNLRRGGETGITFEFTPEKSYRALKAKVSGVVAGLEVPFNGVPSDACSGLTSGACPLQAGQNYVYRANIPVSGKYPRIPNVQVKFFLVDADTDERVACAKVRVNLV